MENLDAIDNDDFQILNIWNKYVKHWPWFVLSVVLCCGIAVLYVKSVSKVYYRTASVLINVSEKPDISETFSSNQSRSNTNVNNEIEAFRSPQLIQEVAKRLKLNINYTKKDGLRYKDLYTQSPIIAEFPNAFDSESFSFQVELLPDSVIALSDFSVPGYVQEKSFFDFIRKSPNELQSIKTKFNTETSTPVGNVVISPSLYYSSEPYPIPFQVSKSDIKATALNYAGSLSVYLSDKQNTVIQLEMGDVSIQRAEDFLNTLITIYQENWLNEKNKVTIANLDFLNEHIPITEQELEIIDNRLEQYKSKNLVTDTREAASLYRRESSEYSGRALEVSNQIATVEEIRAFINNKSKTSELIPNITGLNRPALESSITQYNTQLLERNRLIANSGEQNPLIIEMNNSLYSLRQSIIQTIETLLASLRLQFSSLQQQESRLTGNIASSPEQEKQLISIEREKTTKEALYQYYLQKRVENEMALIVTRPNSQVISPPVGSMNPVKPQKKLIMLIAIFFGVGIPGGIIWGSEIVNFTIRSKKDLAELHLPLLGVIPNAIKNRKREMLFVQEYGRDMMNESFRILRTNLDFICKQDDMRVIQFVSIDSGSGKTVLALNLAMSLAISGKKVALVDLDMRTATLSKLVENPGLGVSYMLSKLVTNEHYLIVKDYFYTGFDIIPVGLLPANPTELLMSEYLPILIERLKNEYDYVLIDCTPADMVADAAIVGQFTDFTVFVIRENFTDRRKLSDIEDVCRSGKFKNIHIVLNASEEKIQSNRYYTKYMNKKSKNFNMLPQHSSDISGKGTRYLGR